VVYFFSNNPGFCLVSWPQPLLLAQIPLLDRLQRLGRPQESPHLRHIENSIFLVSRVFGKRTQMAVEKVTDISKFVLNPARVLKISPVPTQKCPGYLVTHPGTKVTLSLKWPIFNSLPPYGVNPRTVLVLHEHIGPPPPTASFSVPARRQCP
jgi:hypothetical protein